MPLTPQLVLFSRDLGTAEYCIWNLPSLLKWYTAGSWRHLRSASPSQPFISNSMKFPIISSFRLKSSQFCPRPRPLPLEGLSSMFGENKRGGEYIALHHWDVVHYYLLYMKCKGCSSIAHSYKWVNKTLAPHFITWKIFPFSLNTSHPPGCPIMLKVLGKGGAGTGVCKHLAQGAILKIAARVLQILFIKFVKVSPEKFKAMILCLLEF